VEVTDFAGRRVVLAAPAQRIIALAPHIVENLYSAGAGDRLVGVVSRSDYPSAVRAIPRVGDFRAWSLESIVELRPDLIVLWGSGNGLDGVAALENLGFPVFVSEPRRLEDIPRAIRLLGRLAGTEAVSEGEARRLEAGFDDLRSAYAGKRELRVFYQIWNEPLQTINGEHMISSILALCSASNVFQDAAMLAPRIGLEAVLARDPDVIVASGISAQRPPWLDEWLAYPQLRAVRENALLFVDPDYLQRPTARALQGARALCGQLDAQRP
jgi:iron complex transport system substrate-binding protein